MYQQPENLTYGSERNYFWDDPDYISNFDRSEESLKESEGDDYEPSTETHRFIYFIQDVKTGKCLTGCEEGYSSFEECSEVFSRCEKVIDQIIMN